MLCANNMFLQEAVGGEKRQRVEEVVVTRSNDTRFIIYANATIAILATFTMTISAFCYCQKFHYPNNKFPHCRPSSDAPDCSSVSVFKLPASGAQAVK